MIPRVAGKCPNCGHNVQKSVSGLIEREGELFEIVPGQRVKPHKRTEFSMADKRRFFAGLKHYAQERGYKAGWAANQYRRKFKVWPDHSIEHVTPEPPTMMIAGAHVSKSLCEPSPIL